MSKKLLCIMLFGLSLVFVSCKEAPKEETIQVESTVEVPSEQEEKEEKKLDARNDPDLQCRIGGEILTARELYFMAPEDFEKLCKSEYQTIAQRLGVTWEEMDWALARDLIYDEIFGTAIPEWAKEEEGTGVSVYADGEEVKEPDLTDPNVVYCMPPRGYISNMTDDEFVEYLKGMFAYTFPDTEIPDFSLLSKEELRAQQKQLAEEIEVDY